MSRKIVGLEDGQDSTEVKTSQWENVSIGNKVCSLDRVITKTKEQVFKI